MDGRRLEDGSPLGPSSAAAELGSRQRPPKRASPNNSATTTGGDEALESTGRPLLV